MSVLLIGVGLVSGCCAVSLSVLIVCGLVFVWDVTRPAAPSAAVHPLPPCQRSRPAQLDTARPVARRRDHLHGRTEV